MIVVNWKQWNSGPDESGLGQGMNMKFKLLLKREESITEKIVDAAFTVHKVLGPDLLERVNTGHGAVNL